MRYVHYDADHRVQIDAKSLICAWGDFHPYLHIVNTVGVVHAIILRATILTAPNQDIGAV
jgi:hypothetical protein